MKWNTLDLDFENQMLLILSYAKVYKQSQSINNQECDCFLTDHNLMNMKMEHHITFKVVFFFLHQRGHVPV